ncbi:tape measure protein [Acinetobacter sp. RF15A]|uniref:tape measure protein n=1 Tax=unclassified Acinetobacter TaxID=196816 RepID=UPI0011979999|nr:MULTISPECIES: tape measure protein [unclassified Acinetobacter]TSH74882.1 tape measure protein [Acinetobacter sp. RF15A]TSI20421.1 tape measure protein [Acinetobacter sp. RF15B]
MAQESVLRIVIDSRNAERNARAVASELENLTKKGDQTETQMTAMGASIKSLVGYMGGILTINKAIAMADGYTQMAARIRNATSSAEEYAMVQDRVLATANTTYRQLGEAQEVYLSMAGGMKSLGYQTTQTLDLVDSLSFSFTHNATRVDQAQSAMDALSKSMAKGKVDGDAWISIVTGADNIIADMAKTTGKSEAEIRKLGAEGKASLSDLIKTLIATRDENERLANSMENSVADGFTQLTNAATVYLGKLNESTGATGVLAGGLGVLAENLDTVVKVAGVTAAVFTGRLVSAYVAANAASIRMTASTMAQAGAMNIATASARSLYLAMGGPVGLSVTLATVTAGYLLMRDKAEKATASIDTQGQSVGYLIEKYQELNTLQRDNETRALAQQVEDLSLKYRVATSDLFAFMEGLPIADEKINTFKKLNSELSQGRIDSNEYYEAIKNVNILTNDQLAKVSNLIGGYVEQKKELKAAEQAQGALEKSMKKTTDKAKEQAVEVANLSEEIKKLLKSSSDNITDSRITEALASRGYNDTMIDLAKKYLAVEGAIVKNEEGKRALRADLQKMLNAEYAAIMRAKGAVDSRNEAEKERTKELEKQQKILTASSKVQANAAKYNFSGLESKYGLPSGTLSAIHAIETGNTGKTNQVNKQSGATGGFQFLAGTAKQYGVKDRTDLAQSAEGAAKYMSYLLKLFKGDLEKAVRAYHAGEGNVQKGKNIGKYNNDYWHKFKGYTAGANGFTAGDVGSKEWEKLLEEAAKMAEQQAELRKNLELNVASEVTRIRTKLADDLQEIDKAGYSPERAKELKAEYQARADNDIAIAEYALKTKLDDYESFKKTESKLLEDSFNERKFYAARDLELTKDERDKAVALLDEQLKQEQALLMLAQETRLFQMREALMSETAAMQERYRLEREQILLNSKLSEEQKQHEIALSKALQEEENRRRLNNAVQQWGGIQAEMNGTGDQYRLEQERFGRMDASQELFDSQLALAETAAEREAIWQAHHDRMTAIESDYQTSSYSLQLGYGQQVTGALSGMFGAMLGESSSAYRALYTAQQSFALAQAGINVWKSASDAYANEPGTWYQKAAAAAIATMKSGTFVTMIQAATPKGFADGGYTGHGGKYDPAGIVHKGEGVLTQEEVKALGGPQGFEDLRKSIRRGYATGGLVADTHRVGMGAVSAINSGGGNKKSSSGDVNIQNTITIASDGSAASESDSKQLGALINNAVLAVIRREQRQGGLLAR